uniref:Polyprotein n=1 Tax=Mycena chlorophos TaxID=658473 RepID=A0ABQ0LT78_MYCCL|nr:polyprotein [Mycena chlorophos]
MGHLPVEAAKKLVKNQLVEGIELDETKPTSQDTCPSCLHGRMTRAPMSKAAERNAEGKVGDQVHSDVWGPATVQTPQHKRYYLTFTDDASRYTVAFLLNTKDQTFEAFKELDARWKKQGIELKILHSDNGGEFKSHVFDKYLAERGIARRLTVHDTPEHNGVAERLNRTLLEKVRAMLHGSGLPKNLWGEALKHAVWLKNRTSTKAIDGKTPFEAFTGKKPDLDSKLEGRARTGHWIGYDQESNGHCVYYPDNGTIRPELSVRFEKTARRGAGMYKLLNEGEMEKSASSKQQSTANAPSAPPAQPQVPPAPAQIPLPPSGTSSPLTRRRQRLPEASPHPPAPFHPQTPSPLAPRDISSKIDPRNILEGARTRGKASLADGKDTELGGSVNTEFAYLAGGTLTDTPTVEEAMERDDWPLFKQAMEAEMDAMSKTGTFGDRLVSRPADRNVVGAKWALRIKGEILVLWANTAVLMT